MTYVSLLICPLLVVDDVERASVGCDIHAPRGDFRSTLGRTRPVSQALSLRHPPLGVEGSRRSVGVVGVGRPSARGPSPIASVGRSSRGGGGRRARGGLPPMRGTPKVRYLSGETADPARVGVRSGIRFTSLTQLPRRRRWRSPRSTSSRDERKAVVRLHRHDLRQRADPVRSVLPSCRVSDAVDLAPVVAPRRA